MKTLKSKLKGSQWRSYFLSFSFPGKGFKYLVMCGFLENWKSLDTPYDWTRFLLAYALTPPHITEEQKWCSPNTQKFGDPCFNAQTVAWTP